MAVSVGAFCGQGEQGLGSARMVGQGTELADAGLRLDTATCFSGPRPSSDLPPVMESSREKSRCWRHRGVASPF